MNGNFDCYRGGSNDTFLLSFCVPTYNRPKEIKNMLEGLLPQITDDVELVIRDDSSDFESKKIFDELVKGKNINYQYFKGEKIGLDAANLFLLRNSRGRFMWWFSDDDELFPESISRILDLIKTHTKLSLIWVNFSFETKANIAVERPSGFFCDGNEALEVLGKNIGLLSTYVVKRETALRGLDIAKRHVVGFSFASTCVFLFVLSEEGLFYFLRGPLILCHPTTIEEIKSATNIEGKIINEGFNVYGIYFYKVVHEFDGKFSKQAIRKILSVNFSALWRGMLVGWVGGWDTPSGKRWKMFKFYWPYPEFWVALVFFLLPLPINRILYKFYRIFFSNRKWRFNW